QTIRKSGSLSGFHGPASKPIKLWTFDAKPNSTVSELERAYFVALDSVDRIEECNRITAATGKLTPEGAKADALQFARSDLLPGLHRAWESITRAKLELAQRKAKLSGKLDASRRGISLGELKEQHAAEIDQVDELEEAIAAAESAVEAA